MDMIKRNNRILEVGVILLVLYIFAGFVFIQTKWASSLGVYLSFIILTIVWSFAIMIQAKQNIIRIGIEQTIWLPYLVYTILGYSMEGKMEYVSYWLICTILVLVSSNSFLSKCFPLKLVYGLAILAGIGIGVQLFFPSFYYENIVNIFTNSSQIIMWGNNYGLAGFTYQLDTTALPILFAEGAFISFSLNNDKANNSKWKTLLIIVVCVIAVFYTGKRMLLLLSIIAPIIVVFLSQKRASKKMFLLIIVGLLSIAFYSYFINHIEEFCNIPYMKRLTMSLTKFNSSDDITTGRSELAKAAINAFHEHPFFGIGISNFREYTNSYTDTHNTYLQVLCEQGIIGFIIFCIPLFFTFIKSLKLLNNNESKYNAVPYVKFSLYVQIIYIIYAFTGNLNINLTGYMMYFFSISMMYSAMPREEV